MNEVNKSNIFGISGLIIAVIALFITFIPAAVDFISPPQEISVRESGKTLGEFAKGVKEGLLNKNQDSITVSIKEQEYLEQNSRQKLNKISSVGSLFLAAVAFVLGLISWIRHENKRINISILVLSVVVVGYQFYLVAVSLIIFAIIMSFISSLID